MNILDTKKDKTISQTVQQSNHDQVVDETINQTLDKLLNDLNELVKARTDVAVEEMRTSIKQNLKDIGLKLKETKDKSSIEGKSQVTP